MKPPKIFKSLKPLVLAALLLSIAAPASHAQRRRTRAHSRSTQRTRPVAPRNVPAQAQPAQPSSAPSASQPVINADERPPASNAVAPRAPDADEQRRAPESDSTLEELVGADTYGAYAELRHIGTLAQASELKTAVAGMKLMGETETKPVTDLIAFITENYEPLAETRAVMLFMAARPRVPEALLALEFPTARDAAAFEPKYRQFAEAQLKAYMSVKGPKDSSEHHPPQQGARAQKPEAKAAAPDYTIRRVGRLIISSEGALSLKRLRGEETAPALADSARFQSARTRFASDSLFVYVDTGVTIQGFTRLSQTDGTQGGVTPGPTVTMKSETTTEVAVIAPAELQTAREVTPTPEPTPEEISTSEEDEGEGSGEGAVAIPSTIEIVKPSEEQIAVSGMGNVMRSLWGGMPRIPGAFALGVRLDGGTLALRLAVENSPDGRVNVLPFFPNFIAGPPVTAEAAEVAPADADIFFTTSLDWEQLYTSTLGTASLGPLASYSVAGVMMGDAGGPTAVDADAPKPPTPDEAVAAIEKLFGFKFKEDLIPSLGNEVAFSMPLDANDLGLMPGRRRSRKKEEEKESEAGPVVIVTLKDADKVQKILPRVLVALGVVPFGDRAAQTERREGFDIHTPGGLSYTFINRFLVMGEDAKAVRHVVDSYAARRTLAATDSYRDSTGWQAPQKLVQAFISDALMRSTVEETKRRSGASTDPLVRTLLAQLEVPPEAASFETTNEGDAVIHEMRVPVSMLQAYALALMVGARDAPVLSGETMATYTLYEIQNAEETFKDEKKKERFGTLEELVAEKILDKGFAEGMGYRIEVNASGEKFGVTATPKEYGKSGRLSFFLDETGTMRAADHKGKPADASDPPVD
ncbi:MAG: DUF3352 domain-containing protein [Pyrinomonadaceae bacterium]